MSWPRHFCHILETLQGFSSFLDKNFWQKLSYDQVLDILETSSVPSVDALAPPTLDTTIINQISNPQTKKYVQECDKELTSVQHSLLNATGPFCCLHDALESKETISNEDIRFMLEHYAFLAHLIISCLY